MVWLKGDGITKLKHGEFGVDGMTLLMNAFTVFHLQVHLVGLNLMPLLQLAGKPADRDCCSKRGMQSNNV